MGRKSTVFFVAAAGIFFALRIFAGRLVSVCFIPQYFHDDALMIRYADLYEHFITQMPSYPDLLVKDMGVPLVLAFVKASGITYPDLISCTWFIAAAVFTLLFSTLTKVTRAEILFLIYVFVLFMPISFSHVGLRLYRNSVLAPFYFVVISMMALLLVTYWRGLRIPRKILIPFNIFFGLIFSLTFYMKEDGVWLLMCLLVVVALCLAKIFFFESKSPREKIFHVIVLILPLIIFSSTTIAYKCVNEKFFGVYEINNRTEGKLGRFLRNVYKVKSDERNGKVWAATDAILKVFETSPTLRENDALKNCVLNTHWIGGGNIFNTPIKGDFLGWVMLSALKDSGTCSSLVEQERYLGKVNAEIEAAFENGTLQKDDKFQISASMGGLSLDEILALRPYILEIYRANIFVYDYSAVQIPAKRIFFLDIPLDSESDFERRKLDHKEIIDKAIETTNVDFMSENPHVEAANIFAKILFIIYSVMNCAMFIAACVGVLLAVIKRNSFEEILTVAIATGALILSAVYALAIAWFCQFLEYDSLMYSLVLYSTGILPLLVIFEIFGTYLAFCRIKPFTH